MNFHEKRRQQFLSQRTYDEGLRISNESIEYFSVHPMGSGDNEEHKQLLARQSVGFDSLNILFLKYTGGDAIDSLSTQLEKVVEAFEKYGEYLRDYASNQNEPAFAFSSIDEYCELMQILGLCYLLHRKDLLPRIAVLQDGATDANGGADALFEEFMLHAMGKEKRHESDYLFHLRPYESLFYGLTEEMPGKRLKEIDLYLKRWYKDLAGTGWHDSHKPNDAGEQRGYYGYWSFEAGAAVLLMGIDDDSSLHKYLYYPKDLVAWARERHFMSEQNAREGIRLRCEAGQPCPREGYWVTPAHIDSRRHFNAGEVMPEFKSDYGFTIWQWDERQ